jgi:cell division inhibitor SepF
MSTVWRRAMVYLGLGPDEEYDDIDQPQAQPQPRPEPAEPARPAVQPRSVRPVADRTASVSPIAAGEPEPSAPRFPTNSPPPEQPTVTPVPAERPTAPGGSHEPTATSPSPAPAPAPASGVRTIARPGSRPHVVAPRSFADAQEVADRFKQKQPVIINLQGVDRDLSRRLVDFSSGLCYGLGGQMEKIAGDVFLLTPSDVEISAEERQRLSERGLYDA